MAIPIIRGRNGVIFESVDPKTGRTNERYRWWAERGLMHWENQSNGNYGSVSIRLVLQRLQAIQDMIRNSRTERGYMKPDDVNRYQRYVDDMIVEIQKAKEQGDPHNAKHSKQHAEDWKAKRHSRLVVVPGLRTF